MKYDFKTVLNGLDVSDSPSTKLSGVSFRELRDSLLLDWVERNKDDIRAALKLADRVMGDVSEDVLFCVIDGDYKAMRDQLLKEVEDGIHN